MPKANTPVFDTVAINRKTNKVRIFERGKEYGNAEAIMKMAIMRRGLDEELYAVTTPGLYEEGDKWHGDGGARDPEAGSEHITVGGISYPRGARGLDPRTTDF